MLKLSKINRKTVHWHNSGCIYCLSLYVKLLFLTQKYTNRLIYLIAQCTVINETKSWYFWKLHQIYIKKTVIIPFMNFQLLFSVGWRWRSSTSRRVHLVRWGHKAHTGGGSPERQTRRHLPHQRQPDPEGLLGLLCSVSYWSTSLITTSSITFAAALVCFLFRTSSFKKKKGTEWHW